MKRGRKKSNPQTLTFRPIAVQNPNSSSPLNSPKNQSQTLTIPTSFNQNPPIQSSKSKDSKSNANPISDGQASSSSDFCGDATTEAIARLEQLRISGEQAEISKEQIEINDQLQGDEVIFLFLFISFL